MAFKDSATGVARLNDYNLRDLPGSASFEVLTISGRGLAPSRDRELQFPGDVGARDYGGKPNVRRLEVSGILYADTMPDFRLGLDKLKELARLRLKIDEILYGEAEAQTLWFADESVIHNGTIATSSTLILSFDDSASSEDGFYDDMEIEITTGAGKGQVRTIKGYTGSTFACTIDPYLAVAPGTGAAFTIRDNRYYLVNYSGTMNETRITNQWMKTGYSNITLPFKAVYPFAVSDWKKQNIASVNAGDFQAISTGNAPSYPKYEIKGGGASSVDAQIVETTQAFQSNFDKAEGTNILNTVITPSVSTGIKHQAGKLNQSLELDTTLDHSPRAYGSAGNLVDSFYVSNTVTRNEGYGSTDDCISDILNANNGTISFWAKKSTGWNNLDNPNNQETLFNQYLWSTSAVYISLHLRDWAGTVYSPSRIYYSVGGYGNYVPTTNLLAGEWYLVVLRWDALRTGSGDLAGNHSRLEVFNSSGTQVEYAVSSTTPNTLSVQGQVNIGSFWYPSAGAVTNTQSHFSGQFDDLAIWDRPLTDSERTALVNGGTGVRADSIGSSDLIYYSDFDGTVGTDMTNPIASSNVDTALASASTTTAVTVNGNGDKIFKDNDRIVLYDETGYKVQGAVNGTATTTNVPIDNLAGGAVTDADKVGVHATASWSNSNKFGANAQGVGDITTGDFTVSLWFKTTASSWSIVDKRYGNYESGYDIYVGSAGVSVAIEDSSATNPWGTVAVTDLDDGKWHHLMVSYDRSADATVYTDGIARGTVDISTAPLTLTSAQHLWVGGGSLGGIADGTGSLRDVAIWNSALTAANALSLATNPLNATAAVSIPAWWWKMDEAWSVQVADSGSVTGADVLGVVGTVTRTQQAYISKNLIADGNMENGGIGGLYLPYASTQRIIKDTGSSAFKDAQGVVYTKDTAGWVSYDGDVATVAIGENYVGRVWFKPSGGSVGGSMAFLGFEGGGTFPWSASNPGHTDWKFYESAGKTNSTALYLGANMYNAGSWYFDDMKILPNLVDNGGMEGGADPPTGWTAEVQCTATSVAAGAAHSGTYSVELKTTSSSRGMYLTSGTTTVVGDYYEISFWAAMELGTGQTLDCRPDNQSIGFTATVEDDWTRYSRVIQATDTNLGLYFYMSVSDGTSRAYLDDVSIVHRPDLSPTLTAMSTNYRYEPTRLGKGYHTGGNENMIYTAVGNKDESSGRVVFRPQFPYNTGDYNVIFWYGADTGNSIELGYYGAYNQFYMYKTASSVAYYATSVQQIFSANDEIEVGWYTDPTSGVQIFVNGSDSGSTRNANTTSLASNPQTLYLGNFYNYTSQTNMVIDDLEILTKSMPAEWFAEQHTKRLASKNQNLALKYTGTLDSGDILTIDCSSTKVITRAELYDASAGTSASAVNNTTLYSSMMPILSQNKSMLYFPNTISNGVDIHYRNNYQ